MRISDWSSDVCSSDLENAIQAPDAQAILERCVFQADPVACAAYDRSDRGQIVRFDDILDNLGTIKTDGWDVNVGWTLPEGDWGRLRFDWKNTFVGRYELVNESGAIEPRQPGDRKSVVAGKRVTVRLGLGGCRIIK